MNPQIARLAYGAGTSASDYLERTFSPERYYAAKIEEQRKKQDRNQTIAAVTLVAALGIFGLVVAKRVF